MKKGRRRRRCGAVVTVCGGVMVLWCLLCGEVLCSGGAVVCGDGVGCVVVVWVVWWCCVEGGVVWWWCCGCDVVALCGGVMCMWWPCDVVWVVWKGLWCGGVVGCGDSMWWCNGAVVFVVWWGAV